MTSNEISQVLKCVGEFRFWSGFFPSCGGFEGMEVSQGRLVDALAHGGDEGRVRLR